MLQNIIDGKSYEKQVNLLEKSTLKDLVYQLKTDTQKKAFWINIYNGFIQDILKDKPELYENRGDFFRKPRVEIGGLKLSFGEGVERVIAQNAKYAKIPDDYFCHITKILLLFFLSLLLPDHNGFWKLEAAAKNFIL